MARREAEAGCFVLLTTAPTAGDVAQSARGLLTGSKDQHGTEQHDGLLKAPVLVKSLLLKKPDRLEALGRIVLSALLLWRLMARAMRTPIDTTPTPWTGWDKTATQRPTAFMRVTQFAGVMVLKRGAHRQLARPLSVVQPQSLMALAVPVAYCTDG